MVDGFYKVHFATQLGEGAGVVMLSEGQLRGGDSALWYAGIYTLSGDDFHARLAVKRHSPIIHSVFGVDDFSVEMSGTFVGSDATLSAKSPQAPDIDFTAILTKLADLA